MRVPAKIKPVGGFSRIVHILLLIVLPLLVFVFVRLRFYELAALLILLAKWRMLAVKPRHWLANIRANAVDITVGLSLLLFMVHSGSQMIQLLWTALYAAWLIGLKPRSDQFSVSLQALVAQSLGLTAVYLHFTEGSLYILVALSWFICYASARHFFTTFEEPMTRFLSHAWGYFAASLAWVLGHWLLFYGVIAQPTLLLSVIAFSLACIYYLQETDRLSKGLRRQLLFIMLTVVIIVMLFSDWGDKAI